MNFEFDVDLERPEIGIESLTIDDQFKFNPQQVSVLIVYPTSRSYSASSGTDGRHSEEVIRRFLEFSQFWARCVLAGWRGGRWCIRDCSSA